MQVFDNIIIGAGQAGPALAARLTKAGQTVAFIERARFGGTCVNTGCTPTKAMVASAYAAHMVRRAHEYGVGQLTPTIDMPAIVARREAIVAKSRIGVEKSLRDNDRITVFTGTASFTSPTAITVGNHALTAPRIFLNVGGRATIPQLPGINTVPYLTNSTIMDLTEVPEHLAIIGGSYIGLEFAQMFRRFGAKVTVIERGPRIIAKADVDISACVTSILEAEGISIRTDADCIALAKSDNGITVKTTCTRQDPDIDASHVLLAVGRQPNTDDLGLDRAGVATDRHGYITVDDQLQTSVPGIYALGDCNGRGAFTHTAYNDFEIVAANLLDNGHRRISDRIFCYAMYTDPPMAHIGLTEAEVRKSGKSALMAVRPMSKVNRAIEKGESLGMMKVLVDADTKKFLGATLLGVGCDEAIHAFLDTMYSGAPYTTVQNAVHIHPTVSELLPTLLGQLKPLS